MLDVEYKILKLLSKESYDISQIKSSLKRHKTFSIENAIDDLEESSLIEELFTKELAAYKIQNINRMSGSMGEPTGKYIITIDGQRLLEDETKDRQRFYMPFFFSAFISLITITISVISLFISLQATK